MSENEDKYHDTVLDLEAKVKDNENIVLKISSSLQTMFMLGPKPMSIYDSNLKHGLGYANPYTLKKAISQNLKLYDASCFSDLKIRVNVRDTEDILDDATKSQKKMENKLNDPVAIEKKQNFGTIDYKKLNALYEDFVSQKELCAEQKYFSSTFTPSKNSSNASTSTSSSETKPSVSSMPKDIKELKEVFDSTESAFNATWNHNELLNDQLLEAKIKHKIVCCVLTNHECESNNVQDEIEKIQRDSIEIQEEMQKQINILKNDVQRCQKQSLDFELQLQHEKERQKCESSLKTVCETSWISKMEKLENENVSLKCQVQSLIKERENVKLEYQKLFDSIKKTRTQTQGEINELIEYVNQKTYAYADVRVGNQDLLMTITELKTKLKNAEKGLSAASSVRRPMNRDSPLKNSVLSNTKKSSEKVEVSVRTNKKTYVASKNVVSSKKIVTDVDVQNALKAKDVLCVSCAKNVLIPCNDKFLANYKLNVHSKVRRALFTTPRTTKSAFVVTTPVVSKTRFSVKTTQSKSLDTTSVVSRTKIALVTPLSARYKVVQIVLWIVDSGCSKRMIGDRSLLRNFIEKFMGTVHFGNDHFAAIIGYGDYVQGNITIAKSGNDESFLANGSLPLYDRLAENTKLGESYLKFAKGHINPSVLANYFGNCLSGCGAMDKTTMLTGKEGFVNAAKLLGEVLHKTLTNKNGPMLDLYSVGEFFTDGMPSTMIGAAEA
ncbi:hypothetical protein Tco_1175198 [Tanacetum coccineum]